MGVIYTSSVSETPPVTGVPPPPPRRRTRKKLYVVLGIIAVAAVASGFGLVIFGPASFSVIVTSTPSGSGFITVDGNPVTTPCGFSWQSGSTHNLTANSPVSAKSGVRYAYSSWADGGAQSHTVTINGSADYAATFLTLIPLTYDYVPGEQMTYNMTAVLTNTAAPPAAQNASETGTMTMDVISFDGENYTINETTTISSSFLNSSYTTSMTLTVNKTGYVAPAKSSAGMQEFSSWFGNFVTAFEMNETEAGETWQIPLNGLNTSNSSISFNGNLTETFGDVQNLTVPAGTYMAFNVDVSGTNLTLVMNYPPPSNASISESFSIKGQVYLEYGTCRMIETNLQMSYSISQNGQTSNASISEQMELVKYVSSISACLFLNQ